MHQTIMARIKNHSASTYLLRFNFDSSYSFTKTMFAGRHVPGKFLHEPPDRKLSLRDHSTQLSLFVFVFPISQKGVCHADDMAYYFKSTYSGLLPSHSSDEWKTIERMTESFTSFAKTGDPNNDVIAPIQWKPVTLEKKDNRNVYKCLNIAKEVSFVDSPEIDRMHYWDKLLK